MENPRISHSRSLFCISPINYRLPISMDILYPRTARNPEILLGWSANVLLLAENPRDERHQKFSCQLQVPVMWTHCLRQASMPFESWHLEHSGPHHLTA